MLHLHEQVLGRARIVDNQGGLLTSIHPFYSRVNTCEQNGCHTPLINDYSSMNKCLLIHECDVALERYRICKIEKPSVCLFTCTFHLDCSANLQTTSHIKAVFAPHEVLIINLCQEYQETLLTAVVCHLQCQEYEGVDKNQLEIFVKTALSI